MDDDEVDEELEFLAPEEQPVKAVKRKRNKKTTERQTAINSKGKGNATPADRIASLTSTSTTSKPGCHNETGKLLAAFETSKLSLTVSHLLHMQTAARPHAVDQHQIAEEIVNLFKRNDSTGVWTIRTALQRSQQSQELGVTITRGRMMQVEWIAWRWLENSIEQAYLSMKGSGDHWLHKLAVRMHTLSTSGVSDVIDAADYLKGIGKGERMYRVKVVPIARRMDNLDNFAYVMQPVMLEWFNFPRKVPDLARRALLSVLVRKFGMGALFVKEVGDVYEHVSRAVDPIGRTPSLSACSKWRVQLEEAFNSATYDEAYELVQALEAFAVDMTGIDVDLRQTGHYTGEHVDDSSAGSEYSACKCWQTDSYPLKVHKVTTRRHSERSSIRYDD